MKKTALFLLALTAAACSSDEGVIEPSVPEVKGTPIVVNATASDNYTKSVFDGQDSNNPSFGNLLWSAADKLGIYYEQSANATADGTPAEKWDTFTLNTGANTNSAKFSGTSMVWNEDTQIAKHQFYAFYPVSAERNRVNPRESPYEKAFSLTNNQSPAEVADAAKNYEKYQILISSTTVDQASEAFTMQFDPILSYLCLHVYADNAERTEFPADAKIYLSRISVMGPENTFLTGNFSINLKTKEFVSTELGSTRGINIALPGLGLELARGGRDVSKPVYAVMLPVDLSGQQITITGLLTVVLNDGTQKKYQLTAKSKTGVAFEQGKGYDIYVKAEPGTDLTSLFDQPINTENRGFIFRSNGKWYSFADYAAGKLTADDFKAMGSDLYFIKADGSMVTEKDVDRFGRIGELVNAIYDAIKTPVNVDMSSLQMDPNNSKTNQFKPDLFTKKDETDAIVANPAWASVAIPEGVRKINVGAFANCTNLKTVTLPNSLTRLSTDAFLNCTSLTSIIIPARLNKDSDEGYNGFMDGIFQGCTALTYVKLPSNIEVTMVMANTFSGCTSLKSIAIPRNITELGKACFADCPLENITIRHRLKMIVIAGGKTPTFSGVAATGTLHVYSELVQAYTDAINDPNNSWYVFNGWTVKALDATEEAALDL